MIVAAGRGNRFGGDLPKQFVLLRDKPVIAYSMILFSNLGYELLVVIHPDDASYLQGIASQYNLPNHQTVLGGAERFHSVQNALKVIPDEAEIVMVHDAARPNIDGAFIEMLASESLQVGNAIPALPLSDSIRMRHGKDWVAVPRDDYRAIQTPQCFTAAELKKAYEQTYRTTFTDDASVLESSGKTIHVVPGKVGNIKITHADDLNWMSYLITKSHEE